MKTGPVPFFVRPIVRGIADKVLGMFVDPQLKLHLGYMESELGKSPWFAGEEMTAADIQMSFPLEAAASRAASAIATPNIDRFLEKIHARPAYQRALERGGPYELLS
jgi:glutathione S-transferase